MNDRTTPDYEAAALKAIQIQTVRRISAMPIDPMPILRDFPNVMMVSYTEMAALSAQCQAEMMTRDEWQEVTVPQGNYRVGVDIPAGKWVVRCADKGRSAHMMYACLIGWGP